jgi:tellurite resistance protein TerC
MERFHLLRFGLAGVLAFVGTKMLLGERWHVSVGVSLGVIATCLGVSVAASLMIAPKPGAAALSGALDADGTDHSDLVTVEGAGGGDVATGADPEVREPDGPLSAGRRPG